GRVARCLLGRRQGCERIAGGGKDRGHALGVAAEQDRPVLDERPAVPPLRAPDELAPAELDLAAAGAREAKRGRRLVAARGADHLDRRAERREAGGQGPADPLVAVQEVARAPADVVRGGGDALSELALPALV